MKCILSMALSFWERLGICAGAALGLGMRYAADLHLHSRYAKAVSKEMTLETIARYARRKGIDVIGTGDALQPAWLGELEEKLGPEEPGWFGVKAGVDGQILSELAPGLRRPLRFVLSTEVHCAPSGTGELQGIHHLIYFPSFAAVRTVQKRLERHGDLSEGRPVVRLTSHELLEVALESGCHFAPAHVMNPYFSSLGSRERHRRLEELFGELTPRLIAAEMGLTSIPPMGRRIASLDAHALFACSDAHSPENIGRECTLLETEPGYDAMFAALHQGTREEVLYCLKFSIHRTRYFLNWCARCETAYDEASCPRGHGRLPTGSRDWLEQIADRDEPVALANTPSFRMYLPLRQLLSDFLQVGPKSSRLGKIHEALLERVGHERYILTKASKEELAEAWSEELAGAIVEQRRVDYRTPITVQPAGEQAELSF